MARHKAQRLPIPIKWRWRGVAHRTYLGPYRTLKRLVQGAQSRTIDKVKELQKKITKK